MPSAATSRTNSASATSKRDQSLETRRMRNRISQKAFRARRAMRLKDLEERLQTGPCSDAERVRQLQDQNIELREQLLECHQKFNSLQVSLNALARSSALVLGIANVDPVDETGAYSETVCVRCNRAPTEQDDEVVGDVAITSPNQPTHQTSPPSESQRPVQELPVISSIIDVANPMAGPITTTEGEHTSTYAVTQPDHLTISDHEQHDNMAPVNLSPEIDAFEIDPVLATEDGYQPPGPAMDLIFPHDLGPGNYVNILELCPALKYESLSVKRTNSPFSDHIDALEQSIGLAAFPWNASNARDNGVLGSIGSILLTFVSLSWQSMMAWHTHTKAHVPLRELTAWRICRTPDRYRKIARCYQPTMLQMSMPHPSIIDWIPWPELRDKLIIHHSANPSLDSLICDIGNSYVVQGDLSLLIKCPQHVFGYVGVWDLVRSIAPEATFSLGCAEDRQERTWGPVRPGSFSPDTPIHHLNTDDSHSTDFQNLSLPVADANVLFSSRELAAQAFKILRMDSGAFNFRLDPAFFGRHPELYSDIPNLMALGVALRPTSQVPISSPRELDVSIIGQYQEVSKYLMGVAFEPSQPSHPGSESVTA